MDPKAQQRLAVLAHVLAHELAVDEAAHVLGLSGRQVRRVLERFSHEGAAALVHGNRGRPPVNRIADADRSHILDLSHGEFAGFNPVHFAETMAETGGPSVSGRSVRRILAGHGMRAQRTVARDATISWDGGSLALPARADHGSWAGHRITVQERLDQCKSLQFKFRS